MTPQSQDKNDTKILLTVAGLVVAGVVGLALIAGLSETREQSRAEVSRVTATPAVQQRSAETPAAFKTSEPAEFGAGIEKTPGSTIGPLEVEPLEVPEFKIDPDADPVARGLEHYRSREFTEAAAYFAVATQANADNGWVHYMLGLSRIQNDRGRYTEAFEAAQAALAIDADDSTALFLQGRSLRNLGRGDEAISSLERSLSLADNGYAANLLGLILIEQGREDEALPVLQSAAEWAPDVAYIHNNLGMALERSGNRSEAIEAYHRAVELDPSHEKGAINLARLEPAPGVPADPAVDAMDVAATVDGPDADLDR